jgi:phosphoenolpyruvate carboxykinase (ATP)
MITAALAGELCNVSFTEHAVFNLQIPVTCPNVPDQLLDPKNTWASGAAYDEKAYELALGFVKNFEHYTNFVTPDIINAGPNVSVAV